MLYGNNEHRKIQRNNVFDVSQVLHVRKIAPIRYLSRGTDIQSYNRYKRLSPKFSRKTSVMQTSTFFP